MKLYTYFASSAAWRVRNALSLKGLDCEWEFVDLTKGEQKSAAYALVNPQQLVPSFVDSDGTKVPDSNTIIAYFKDRRLTARGAWKLASAALLPGALLVCAGIVLYGLGVADLLRRSRHRLSPSSPGIMTSRIRRSMRASAIWRRASRASLAVVTR